jgi:hypothetical protein
MINHRGNRLTLDRPIVYQIKVPGVINPSEVTWATGLEVSCEGDPPISILTGVLDQAALHGLLRRLYSIGFPLISVQWTEGGSIKNKPQSRET